MISVRHVVIDSKVGRLDYLLTVFYMRVSLTCHHYGSSLATSEHYKRQLEDNDVLIDSYIILFILYYT